jgi:hypothetical protein
MDGTAPGATSNRPLHSTVSIAKVPDNRMARERRQEPSINRGVMQSGYPPRLEASTKTEAAPPQRDATTGIDNDRATDPNPQESSSTSNVAGSSLPQHARVQRFT